MNAPTDTVDLLAAGVKLRVVRAGPADGPLVILLHGFPEFSYGWRRQIGPLAEAGFRVLAPDQRGYNDSDKPSGVSAYELDRLAADVLALIDGEGRDRAHLVGHDWGGIVAWWTAARHPDSIAALAILNAPHPAVMRNYMLGHPSQALRSAYVGFFQVPVVPEVLMRLGGFALLRRSLTTTSRPGTFSSADLARYEEAWARPGALSAMLNWYRGLRRRPSLPDARVRPRTLVLWGMRDRFLEKGLAEASLALCERGRMLPFAEASHWLHLEEAPAVNAALIDFFREA